MNKLKELTKWRDITYSWVGGLNSIKMSGFPNFIYGFNAIQAKA